MTTTRQELEARLATFAAAQVPSIPVSYESVPFTRPTSGMWLECFFVSGPTVIATLDATTNRERGIWAVNCWIQSGTGVGKLDTLAAQVVAIFKVIPKVGSVSIEQPGSKGKINITNDGWCCLPITFPYRVESLA